MNDLVKKWRLEAGMTQAQLAEKLFMTPQAVSLIENGKRGIQKELFEKIASIFNKEIVFYVNDQPSSEKPIFTQLTKALFEKEIYQQLFHSNSPIELDKNEINNLLAHNGISYFTKTNSLVSKEALDKTLDSFKSNCIEISKAKGILLIVEGHSNSCYDDFDSAFETLEKCIDRNHTDVLFSLIVNADKKDYTCRLVASGY